MLQELVAGESLKFPTAGGAYPASAGWTLSFVLVPRNSANPKITINATADGDDFETSVAASTTATWAADNYSWEAWVDRSGERYRPDSGQIVIKPSLLTVPAGYDGRSPAAKALDDARAAFYAWNPTQRRYRIGYREMEFNSTADILKKIRQLEQEVRSEDVLAGRIKSVGRRIFSRI